MTPPLVVTAACCLCLAGALAVLPVCRNRRLAGQVNLAATGLAALLAAGAAAAVLAGGAGEPLTLLTMPEYASALRLQVDGLSAVFLLLIALVSTAAALYSLDYMAHYPDYGLHRYYPHFQLFVGGMYAIVTLTDLMVGFLLCWQVMTLASFALVRFEHRNPENVRAATRYLLAMQGAVVLILLGAGILAQGRITLPGGELLMRYDFDAIAHGMPGLLRDAPGLAATGLLCLLAGFGIKAGMWPFGQWWLPAAHPAAPSPVSALLSGVMIKTGVYGLMRTFLWLVPAEAAVDYRSDLWGLLLAGLGTLTLFIGTSQALAQPESKRLLAYSSIGQVGYILLALGASVALLPAAGGDPALLALAVVGFAAALFHTLNHGLYKGLLFLNAGTLLFATGSQELNRMGGLAQRLPWTAGTALIGSLAIAGAPLLNGFASKWAIFVTVILGGRQLPLLALYAVVALITSVLTLALFLKFFGVTFLGRASRQVLERGAAGRLSEGGGSMRAAQIGLAAGCLLLGLAPQLGFWLTHRALQASPQGLAATLGAAPPLETAGGTGLLGPAGLAVLAPATVAVALGLLFLLAAGISGLGGAARRRVEPWLCGYAVETDAMRYGAQNLYREVARFLPGFRRSAAGRNGVGTGRASAGFPRDAASSSTSSPKV